MKNILLACLLGIGTLLPTSEVKSSIVKNISKIIDIGIEQNILSANSGESDGKLKEIQIYDISTGRIVSSTPCEGFSTYISIAELPSGKNYIAYVIAENNVGTLKFKK